MVTHQEEFKRTNLVQGWTEDEINNDLNDEIHWGIKLMLKDIKGKCSLQEKIIIELDLFLGYNNIDYLSQEDMINVADRIIKLTKSK